MTADAIRAALLGRMSSAFSTKSPGSNISAIMAAVAAELQEISDVQEAILAAHQYENATGASLDAFAGIHAVTRGQTDTDEDVRRNVAIAVSVKEACGTIEDVLTLITRVTGYAEENIDLLEFESTIPEGGWGKQPWGSTGWGGRYPSVANFRLVFHGSGGGKAIRMEDLVRGVNIVKSAGVSFYDGATIFRSSPVTIRVSTPGSYALLDAWSTVKGWGSAWGSAPWGGRYIKVTAGPSTATPTI